MLVTGAGGSIGRKTVQQLVRHGAGSVGLLDRDDCLLHDLAVELSGSMFDRRFPLLHVDVQHRDQVLRAFETFRPELVVHAAALKHVATLEADPANAATFYNNRAAYVEEIKALDIIIRENLGRLPTNRRTIVTSHDAFKYFGRDYGLNFLAPQGLSTESEASAQDVARLIVQMRKEGISAVFVENVTDPRLLEQIAKETGAKIGGTLYPGALSGPGGPAPTYVDLMRHNYRTLEAALGIS